MTTSGFGGCSTNTDRRVPFRTDLDETPVVVERSRWSAIRAAVLAKGVDSPRVEHTHKGRARANLGDTMYGPYGVADLEGRILKWPKTDEKL